ncbi:DUF4352 domain-containing protein, partial [Clostridium sp. DL1XJH146]
IKKHKKVSAWGFLISGIGIFISISFAGLLSAILFLIVAIMMFARKAPEEMENSLGENDSNDNLKMEQSKKSKKKLPIVIGSVIALIVVFAMIGSGGASTSNSGETESVAASGSTSDDNATNNSSSKDCTEDVQFNIGDSVEVGELQYTALGISVADTLEANYLSSEAQGEYYIVEVKVKNIGKESATIDTALFTLIEDDGTEYSADTYAGD